VITGASDGIGVPTAMAIAKTGARTILACRNIEKGQKVADEIIQESGNPDVEVMKLDLGSFDSVRNFVSEFLKRGVPLHLLINNAGVFSTEFSTIDGIETHFYINHLSHFLLTNLLLDTIIASAPARIVVVGSDSHYEVSAVDWDNLNGEKDTHPSMRHFYCQSKLFNVIFALDLQANLKKKEINNVIVYAVHPGSRILTSLAINSPFYVRVWLSIRYWLGWSKTPEQGSHTTLTAALDPQYSSIYSEGGLYLRDCAPVEPSDLAKNRGLAQKLWEISENLTKLK